MSLCPGTGGLSLQEASALKENHESFRTFHHCHPSMAGQEKQPPSSSPQRHPPTQTPQPSRATTTHKRASQTSAAPRAGLRPGGWWLVPDCACALRPRPSPRRTHRWVPDAAGEGHSAALPAGVQVSAVEVDIEVPVVGPSGSAARPLGGGRGARVSQARPRSPSVFGDRPRLAGSGLEAASQVGTPPPTGRAWVQGHQSSSRLLTRLMGAGASGKGLLSLSP